MTMRTHLNFPVVLLGLVALPVMAASTVSGLEQFKTGDPAKSELVNKNFRYLDSAKVNESDFSLLKSAIVAKLDRSEMNGRNFSDFAIMDSVNEKLLTKPDSQKVVQIFSSQLRAGISLTDSSAGYSSSLSGSSLTFYRKPSASMALSIGSIVFSNLKSGVRPQSIQISNPNEISFSFDGATSADIEKVLTVNASKSANGQGLSVLGNINLTGTLIAPTKSFPDFVFSPTYKLPSLTETETYIAQNGHLPNVPSAKEVEKTGIDLVQMNQILLQKVEELTLHAIAQQKQIDELKTRIPSP